MAAGFRISQLTRRQLLGWLSLLVAALALPTAILVGQAYSQLKWESFHQHRELAEELTQRIDEQLVAWLEQAERRSFADYSFLVVEGDSASNFLQRSPLSAFPVNGDLPGVVGYFQVNGNGVFSTPLLPRRGTAPEAVGISGTEFNQRLALARDIINVLRDNRLVQDAADLPVAADTAAEQQRVDAAGEIAAAPSAQRGRRQVQAAFDALSAPREAATKQKSEALNGAAAGQMDDNLAETESQAGAAPSLGKVADLNLQTPYAKKLEESIASDRDAAANRSTRASRKEQVVLPESPPATTESPEESRYYQSDVRIDAFESEIDPLEFSLLDSGHFVLFRKVWRDRERFIQGMLVDRDAFLHDVVDEPFRDSVTAGMSDLVVAYDDDVIHTGSGTDALRYASQALQSPAPLLFRHRLSSPLDRLELIFRVRQLPPGPGATVLGWVTLALGAAFCVGFFALYRLGSAQIDLARQQQDFVSAVSHELKTPLTSIRMYGEMLKEGWADPDKRQQYYEYIHDESERLTRLIANVLKLASISRNRPDLDVRPVAVNRLMRDIEARIGSQVRLAGFELQVERDPQADDALVSIDEDAFMQVMINLVDNAIKFSARSENKRVELSCRPDGDGRIRFAVRDHGPGVPKDQMRKIFRLFYRSENELTRETVGTGIGLAIVHELAVAMDGRIDVQNRDPGAEFVLSVPRHEAPSPAETA